MPRSPAPNEPESPHFDDVLDPTGVLSMVTALVGLGTVGLLSLLQIIGLLT